MKDCFPFTLRQPHHGSLIQQEHLFRYTPYKGFFGYDSFCYSISDVNMNTATGTVTISVLISPPQFVSLPHQLIATEDKISLSFRYYLNKYYYVYVAKEMAFQ